MSDINMVLIENESFSQVLRQLIDLKNKERKIYSHDYLIKKIGMKSKGYISDILSERRKINLSKVNILGRVFGLDKKQLRLFRLLAELDHMEGYQKEEHLALISFVKQDLKRVRAKLSRGNCDPFFMSKVYCAFALVEERPTSIEVLANSLKEDPHRIQLALKDLCSQGWVLKKENETYDLNHSDVVFDSSDDDSYHFQMAMSYLNDAREKWSEWFEKRDLSYFNSVSLSVKQDDYQKVLKEFKDVCEKFQVKALVEEGDNIIHFNIQIYPELDQ